MSIRKVVSEPLLFAVSPFMSQASSVHETLMALRETLRAIDRHVSSLVVAFEHEGSPADSTKSPFMTVAEAAEYRRTSPARIYNLLSEGRLSRVKDGRKVLVLRQEVEELHAIVTRRKFPALAEDAGEDFL